MTTARSPRALAHALRLLADEVEAGTRELSPAMTDALTLEFMRADDADHEALDPSTSEEEWGKEIDRRLAEHRSGKAPTRKLADVIAELRGRR